ncbi:MAG: aminotransferase class V-fold PLP-dependent enzyme [Bdellovibrionota bacterium]|jgi:cysteine desulfurase/selenocysteine lyase
MKTLYFDNAGAGLMSNGTFNTVVDHMKLEMKIGAYKAAIDKQEDVNKFYELSAKMLNADNKSEIAFVDSASRGWNLIMYGIKISACDKIVTLSSEYGTNLLTIFDIAKKTGCSVNVIPCKPNGDFSLENLESALRGGGTILAVSHVAAQGSIVNPVVEMGKMARKYGATYIVDGCQAVGQIVANMKEINCDAYVAAGRKWLRGPRGTGILYVKDGANIYTPQIDLASADLIFDSNGDVKGVKVRDDAKQFELWEKSIASLLGLGNAINEYLEYGVEKASLEIERKANKIRDAIMRNQNIYLFGKEKSRSGIASFYLKDPSKEVEIKTALETESIVVSLVCDWDCPIFFPDNGSKFVFRFSPHYYTDNQDVETICSFIDQI